MPIDATMRAQRNQRNNNNGRIQGSTMNGGMDTNNANNMNMNNMNLNNLNHASQGQLLWAGIVRSKTSKTPQSPKSPKSENSSDDDDYARVTYPSSVKTPNITRNRQNSSTSGNSNGLQAAIKPRAGRRASQIALSTVSIKGLVNDSNNNSGSPSKPSLSSVPPKTTTTNT